MSNHRAFILNNRNASVLGLSTCEPKLFSFEIYYIDITWYLNTIIYIYLPNEPQVHMDLFLSYIDVVLVILSFPETFD